MLEPGRKSKCFLYLLVLSCFQSIASDCWQCTLHSCTHFWGCLPHRSMGLHPRNSFGRRKVSHFSGRKLGMGQILFFALNILNQRWAGGLWFLACAAILFHGALHFFEGITAADLRLDPYPGFCQPFLCRPRHCKMAGSRAADGAVGKSYIRSSFANTCSGNRNNNKNKNCVS